MDCQMDSKKFITEVSWVQMARDFLHWSFSSMYSQLYSFLRSQQYKVAVDRFSKMNEVVDLA